MLLWSCQCFMVIFGGASANRIAAAKKCCHRLSCKLKCNCPFREQVEQLLEAANWAPTHGRTEPWRFVVLGKAGQQQMLDLSLKVPI